MRKSNDGEIPNPFYAINERLKRIESLLQFLLHNSKERPGTSWCAKDGTGLSTGQKHRILIARAIYKDPEFLFLDEATSSLDAENENQIMDKLQELFEGKTALIIAHRLSTVKNADQIAVLEGGEIVEIGTHEELVFNRGAYFNLIRNQLELGA